MAIERKEMGEETEEVSEVSESTVDIPVSILAGQTVAPGDVIKLEVVSSDDGSGTVTVKYAAPEPEPQGIAEAAAQFS